MNNMQQIQHNQPQIIQHTISQPQMQQQNMVATTNQESALNNAITEKIDYITSPMVGTFYRSASPTSQAFIEIGQEVKVGQVLCIIEAMKLMNQIESEKAGIIKEILIKDGAPVEYGQNLFVIA